MDLLYLFLSSLLAATIFPAQSEIVLVALQLSGNHSPLILLIISTSGNVLGSVFNWVLGVYVVKFKDKKWFPVGDSQLIKYSNYYSKWGHWSLLFAWLPIVGDPITLISGIFRVNFWLFLALVTIGKLSRYYALLFLFSEIGY